MNKRQIVKILLTLAALAACVGLLMISKFYTKEGEVTKLNVYGSQYVYEVVDTTGEVWEYKTWVINTVPFQVGDKVKILINNNGTDTRADDFLQDLILIKAK